MVATVLRHPELTPVAPYIIIVVVRTQAADTKGPQRMMNRSVAAMIDSRAAAFVEARLAGAFLPAYPGLHPVSLAEAYKVQDDAISAWPQAVRGWKVGRITGDWATRFGADRLAGPIFDVAFTEDERTIEAPGFAGGFIAVEGELVMIVGRDAPPERLGWSAEDAAALVDEVRLGIEIASSPFAEINEHGPLVTISDFGNNHGLIIGPAVPGGPKADPASWRIRTQVDGVIIGEADASSIPGGPVESLRALAEICARRGRPLRAGDVISTGAVTGVHAVEIDAVARIDLVGVGGVSVRIAAQGDRRRHRPTVAAPASQAITAVAASA